MRCSWCGGRFWPWQKLMLADISGPTHRKCWHTRWDSLFGTGHDLRFFSTQILYEMLLTVPAEHMAAVQAELDERSTAKRGTRAVGEPR